MTREEITSSVTALGDLIQVLRDADPADKAEVYSQLGLTLTYHPEDKRVIAEARPETIMYVGKCPRGDCTKKPMLARGRVRPWSGGLTMPADLPAGHLLPYSALAATARPGPVRAERGGYFEFCRRLAPCWTGAAR